MPAATTLDEHRRPGHGEPARAALEVLLTDASVHDGSRFVRPVAAAKVVNIVVELADMPPRLPWDGVSCVDG